MVQKSNRNCNTCCKKGNGNLKPNKHGWKMQPRFGTKSVQYVKEKGEKLEKILVQTQLDRETLSVVGIRELPIWITMKNAIQYAVHVSHKMAMCSARRIPFLIDEKQ